MKKSYHSTVVPMTVAKATRRWFAFELWVDVLMVLQLV
jgi:hypothetical protein